MAGTILANGATEAIYIFQDGSDIKYKIVCVVILTCAPNILVEFVFMFFTK